MLSVRDRQTEGEGGIKPRLLPVAVFCTAPETRLGHLILSCCFGGFSSSYYSAARNIYSLSGEILIERASEEEWERRIFYSESQVKESDLLIIVVAFSPLGQTVN